MSISNSPRAAGRTGGLCPTPAATWLRATASRAYRALFPQFLRARIRAVRNARMLEAVRFAGAEQWVAAEDRENEQRSCFSSSVADMRGVNLLGYMSGQFGLGVSARAYTSALLAVGHPVAVYDSALAIPHARNDRSMEKHIHADVSSFDTTIVFVNPDHFAAAIEELDGKVAIKRLIGCWFWELPRVPEAWQQAIERVDEIVVATDFIADAFRAATDKPVIKIPFPLLNSPKSQISRRDIGVPEHAYVFLCTFDCNSSVDRKNPEAVIRAFITAFSRDRDDVFLLMKSSNGQCNPDALRQLLALAATDRRIAIRDGVLDVSHMNAIQGLCDCYVSLHRAEGLGLGMAESMHMGKPVIATGWSGNLEFMDRGNSYLVDYLLVPVRPGQYPHSEGQVWAEPDIEHAACHMRSVVDDRERAAVVAEAGRQSVSQAMSLELTGQLFASYLNQFSNCAAVKPAAGGYR